MKYGPGRFEYYLEKLETLLSGASKESNPALFLYRNDARTILFMLEGLSKLYAGLHNEKKFTKLKDDFKSLEDGFGAVDYYDAFAQAFEPMGISEKVIEYLKEEREKKLDSLNDILEERKWISKDLTRLKKIRKKLREADWMEEGEEVKEIEKYYRKEIHEINAFASGSGYKFTDVEMQVHALRRKLRWLSIYPRALQGMIQLSEINASSPDKKYLTSEIIGSSFNKMPDKGEHKMFLMLDKNNFYALSWMISTLGTLKDNGLKVIALAEALEHTGNVTKEASLSSAYTMLGESQQNIASILSEASAISEAYFKEKNLDRLVAGIAAV